VVLLLMDFICTCHCRPKLPPRGRGGPGSSCKCYFHCCSQSVAVFCVLCSALSVVLCVKQSNGQWQTILFGRGGYVGIPTPIPTQEWTTQIGWIYGEEWPNNWAGEACERLI